MLRSLSVRNFALITELKIEFNPAFTVITGETGAGKSIVIQAIAMLMGHPATATDLKDGSAVAVVEGYFRINQDDIHWFYKTNPDLELDKDRDVVIRREIQRSGRSRYFMNDQTVIKSFFIAAGHRLLDINSQHSHQMLMNSKHHLLLYDSAIAIEEKLKVIEEKYSNLRRTDTALKDSIRKSERLRERRQLIQFQINEIDSSNLVPGEKVELIQIREKLRYADEIRESLHDALNLCVHNDVNLTGLSDQLIRLLNRAVGRDPSLEDIYAEAETVSVTLNDLGGELQSRIQNLDYSPEKLAEISERLHFLQDMEGRYQDSIEGILEYRTVIEDELNAYTDVQSGLEQLKERWMTDYQAYTDADIALSAVRREYADSLCRKIEAELDNLGMNHASFQIDFYQPYESQEVKIGVIPERFSERGTDDLQFMLSANPGVPLKPLSKVASGGELSRIMLALKQHLSSSDRSRTIIFDEVDSGIGGDVANAVASQLKKLSAVRQILTVTHLPQIAVRADQHILVTKTTTDTRTTVKIDVIPQSEREEEIARMLSGDKCESHALEHAVTLLKKANYQR